MKATRGKTGEAFLRGAKLLRDKRPDEWRNLTEGLAKIAPDVADYVIGFVYGDIWSRKGFPLKEKSLVTVAALAVIGHAAPQLNSHIGGALKCGCTEAEIDAVLGRGAPEALSARARELVDLSAMAARGGMERLLEFRIGQAMERGCTKQDVIETFMQIIPYAGFPRAINAIKTAQGVFGEKPATRAKKNAKTR